MKKTLLLTSMLLALTVSVALAGGVNFAWGTLCYTENPVSAVTFACATNTFSAGWPMTASFVVDTPIPDFVGVEIVMEGQSDQATLPDWWKVGAAPDCRSLQATFAADFSGVAATCLDWNGGSPLNVFGYSYDTKRAHISAASALAADAPIALTAGDEWYAGQVKIKNNKTVGKLIPEGGAK